MPMSKEERAAYKAKMIKHLKELNIKPSPEQDEMEMENEPPEGDYEDNPAFSEKSMESAYEKGGPSVRGRMQELQDMRKADVAEKRAKLARYRQAWRNMKPSEE